VRILGLDPGLITGYCIIERGDDNIKIIDMGEVKTGDSTRFLSIYNGIKKVIEQHSPSIACVEVCFVNINPKTSLLLSALRGVLLLVLEEKNINYLEYSAIQMRKRVLGNGKIKKECIKNFFTNKFNRVFTHNTSDALLASLMVLDEKLTFE
jgi:crossover junction endodeoxyribonuclease RuvC